MNHIILLLICIIFIEVYYRYNLIAIFNSIIQAIKRVFSIILNRKISDQWKEKAIQLYSFTIMQSVLNIIFILIIFILLILVADFFLNNFIKHITSFFGILEGFAITSGYIYLKKHTII